MFDLYGRGWQMLEGGLVTLELMLATLPFLILLGLLGASAKLSRFRVLNWIGEIYTTVVRGIPELVIILLIYFGGTILINMVGEALFDIRIDIPPFAAGVLALSLVHGAFATEVFRAAFQAVPLGQVEAAFACGMTTVQVFFRVRLPQVWRYALPGVGNLFQVLIKDTALISVVGLEEIMRKAAIGAGTEKAPFTFYLAAMVMFLLLTSVSLIVFHILEKRAMRGIRRA